MRIFIDSEFWERGPNHPIELISIALVTENGDELHVVNWDFSWPACDSEWLHENVKPNVLQGGGVFRSRRDLAQTILEWIHRLCIPEGELEFWGYYADYDWVVFCQIFGSMVDLPQGFPKYCMDVKQLCKMMGNPKLPDEPVFEHNALYDARWTREAFKFLWTLSKQ